LRRGKIVADIIEPKATTVAQVEDGIMDEWRRRRPIAPKTVVPPVML
jgi:hypothetical protein